MEYPALSLSGFKSTVNGKFIFPILFYNSGLQRIRVSGVLSSGTTSKQLSTGILLIG
jgi:hypothetical protein